MARILAIDLGQKRTGIATTDPLQIIATALDTVPTHTLLPFLKAYMAKQPTETIVVGLPIDTQGQPSALFAKAKALMATLAKLYPAVSILPHDERFTSVMAKQTILASGIGKMARRDKAMYDKVSATIILQSYLEERSYKRPQ